MTLCKALAIFICLIGLLTNAFCEKAIVWYSSDPIALKNGETQPEIVKRLVDEVVLGVTGQPSLTAAWSSLVKPGDRVGIKIDTVAGSMAGTHPAVVDALVDGLKSIGVPSDHIIVWDKRKSDLLSAGFRPHRGDYQLRWTEGDSGYDDKQSVTLPLLGRVISGDLAFEKRVDKRFAPLFRDPEPLSDQSFFSKVLTQQVDKIINVSSMTDSFYTGVAGAISNMTWGNMDNWRRFTKPPLYGDPYLVEIYAMPFIRDKIVLNLMDGLALQFAGGPQSNPDYVRPHQTIYGSFDPVAIDTLSAKLIDEYRLLAKLPSIQPQIIYLKSAEQLGLGSADTDLIEVKRVGLDTFE